MIKKSAVDNEPVKTGAPIAFIKFNRLMGKERIEKLNPYNKGDGANGNGGSSGNGNTPARDQEMA